MGMSKGHACHLNCFMYQAFPLLAQCGTGAEGLSCYPVQTLHTIEEKKLHYFLLPLLIV